MRPYRLAASAERDARAERRLGRTGDDGLERPQLVREDHRQSFDWTFAGGGISWSLHFEPNPKDVRQWRVFRDGQPWMCAGLRLGPASTPTPPSCRPAPHRALAGTRSPPNPASPAGR